MGENNQAVVTNETRIPYAVNVEPVHFEPDSEGKYLTSIELCELTRDIFKVAFANFYGCKFEFIQGVPSISLFFSHIDAPENGVVATERSGAKVTGQNVIDATRNRDNLMRNGDRYVLTEDGLDIIKPLLLPQYYNKGKVDQKRFVSEVSDSNQASMFSQASAVQVTKVAGIDPRRIAAMIWGEKDEDGLVDYGISVLKDLSFSGMNFPGAIPSNYMLNITRAHTDTITKTCSKLCINAGSNIIR